MDNTLLQATRKNEIPQTIEKYKTLIDGIFKEVSKDFPVFKDIHVKNDDGDTVTIKTAEEQLYDFMLMREKAIDHADRMLNKINQLELELNSPELFNQLKNESFQATEQSQQTVTKRNWTKKNATK